MVEKVNRAMRNVPNATRSKSLENASALSRCTICMGWNVKLEQRADRSLVGGSGAETDLQKVCRRPDGREGGVGVATPAKMMLRPRGHPISNPHPGISREVYSLMPFTGRSIRCSRCRPFLTRRLLPRSRSLAVSRDFLLLPSRCRSGR